MIIPPWLLGPAVKYIAVAVMVAGTLGYTYHLGGEEPRARLEARRQADAKQALHELKNKERTDNEANRRLADLNRELARLRNQPVRPIPAPPDSKCPAGQACFDAAELDRARGELYREIRSIAGEGKALSIELEEAREWASDGD